MSPCEWRQSHLASFPVLVLEAADAARLVRVDPTGRRAISRGGAANARIELWDVASVHASVRTANTGAPIDGLLASDRDRIAVQQVGYATLLMTATLEPIAQLDGMPVAFRPGSDELLTGENDALLRYSSRDGAPLGEHPCPDSSDHAWIGAFSRDGAATAIACERSLWLRERDADPAAEPLFRIAFLDNERIVAAGHNGYLEVIDVSGRQRTAPEVMRMIADSPRWRVANGRVVERQ